MTRRGMMRQVAGAAAAAAVLPGRGRSQEPRPGAEPSATEVGGVIARESNGTVIHQLTTERHAQSDIYCEVPYCSRDSKYIVYQRTNRSLKGNQVEFMVVELGTWKEHRLDVGATQTGCAISPNGFFYYLKADGKDWMMLKADLAKGTPEVVYRRKVGSWIRTLGTVSADDRYFAGGVGLDDEHKMFGVILIDLKTGGEEIIDRDPYIFNAHPQFDPGNTKRLMIQHNRGGRFSRDGKLERMVGPEGATIYALSVPDGKRTELKVGPPYTTSLTGHEAWVGTTGEIILSVTDKDKFVPERGNMLALRPGGDYRVASSGYSYNHVGVTPCGRLFTADDYRGNYDVVIGSVATGRTTVVFPSRTTPTSNQDTHAHPYLTPDLKWVIFNSTRSGWTHVYAARVPDEITRKLLPA